MLGRQFLLLLRPNLRMWLSEVTLSLRCKAFNHFGSAYVTSTALQSACDGAAHARLFIVIDHKNLFISWGAANEWTKSRRSHRIPVHTASCGLVEVESSSAIWVGCATQIDELICSLVHQCLFSLSIVGLDFEIFWAFSSVHLSNHAVWDALRCVGP